MSNCFIPHPQLGVKKVFKIKGTYAGSFKKEKKQDAKNEQY